MDTKFYTVDQVAEMLGIHHKTIRKFISEGKLCANKVGKQWRISGHDLSVFMEKNDENANQHTVYETEEESIEFNTKEAALNTSKTKVSVSSVIEINETSKEQFSRVSNMLIAVANCKDADTGDSSLNIKYYEKERKLRVMVWGTVKFTEGMLNTISLLTDTNN
jgi:excisionase family DNA binding protein